MHHDRVKVHPQKVKKGENVKIKYQGLLKESGAEEVLCHYGYDGWQQKGIVPMQKSYDGSFTCELTAKGQKEINFCFKDNADNWDDNNGWNWHCEISPRGLFF